MPLPHSGNRQSERAYEYSLHTCGKCPHLHVALHDQEGNIYADFTMSLEQLARFVPTAARVLATGESS